MALINPAPPADSLAPERVGAARFTQVGKPVTRIDAVDKVTGRAKFTYDLLPTDHLVAKVVRSTIASGRVLSFDLDEALAEPGVVAIFTCLDEGLPTYRFASPGHPWVVNPEERGDIEDRTLMDSRVRQYGDTIGVLVAEDTVAAERALRKIKVEYEEYPVVFTYEQSQDPDYAPPIHEECPNNIQADWLTEVGVEEAGYSSMEELLHDPQYHSGSYHMRTPRQQQAHIELCLSFCYEENGQIVCVTSTQIPHIVRRVIGQALEIPWGDVRVIKPFVGGGFGNKQDVLYEPLNAWVCHKLGGRCVLLELTREEVFEQTRSRQPKDYYGEACWDDDMNLVARSCEGFSNSGGYASHGQAIIANGLGSFRFMYSGQEKACRTRALTFYSNQSTAGAMRAYGVPEATWAAECMVSDIAHDMGWDGADFRAKNAIKLGYEDVTWPAPLICQSNGIQECIERGRELIGWDEKKRRYANETGPVRHGVGMSLLCYKCSVGGLELETASARMTLNQDGSVVLTLGATEIGQGCDTVMCQMCAEVVGVPVEKVHIVSTQDTNISPYGAGAYASRQTYVTGMTIKQVGAEFKAKILDYARYLKPYYNGQDLDIADSWVVDAAGRRVISLEELSTIAYYDRKRSDQIEASGTTEEDVNSFCLGACFVDVTVDIPMATVTVNQIVQVHDSGQIINPKTAEQQVHGGIAQSLGMGLYEELIEDPATGKTRNGNLLDYKIPTTMDVPDLTAEFVETWDPTGPFGNKSLGEPPCIPCAPAIRDAVLDATGVKFYEAPMTQQRLFEGFKAAGLL